MAENAIKGKPNPKVYLKTSEQVFKKAEEMNLLGDEESAYVMYMRFFNLISAIKKTAEYKKNTKYFNEMIGAKNSIRAIAQAEELSESLKNRYDEREARKVSKKLEALTIEHEKEDMREKKEELEEEKEDLDSQKETKTEEGATKVVKLCTTVHELYALMTNSAEKVLIMDVRPPEQFAVSHINHPNCMNVPSEIIPPGTTVSYIEKALPEASKSLWTQRVSMDHIVMLDWRCDSSSLTPSTTLSSLKDALYKWDLYTQLKCEPTVLEGGYDEWLNYYPTLSTNANVSRPPSYDDIELAYSLDNINYELDQAFHDPPDETSGTSDDLNTLKQESDSELNTDEPNKNMIPMFDRSLKPKARTVINNQATLPGNNINRSKVVDLEVIKNKLKKELSSEDYNDNINIDPVNNSDSVSNIHVPSSGSKTTGSYMPTPKVSNLPGVNRALKPRLDTKEGSILASTEHEAAKMAVEKAQEELTRYKLESRRLIEERSAKIEALEEEERKLETVKQMKKVELAQTADVMRAKRHIQQELAELESEKKRAKAEEYERQQELEKLKQEEAEKLRWKQEAARLRALKKQPNQERAPTTKQNETHKMDNGMDEREQRVLNEKDKFGLDSPTPERKVGDVTDKEKRDKADRAKAESWERQEQARAAEIKRLQKERVEKERIERNNKMAEQREAETGTSLPVGWQKRLDPITNQYKYMDPNKGIHQTPPGSPKHSGSGHNRAPGRATPSGPSTPDLRTGLYKTRLKDEGDESSGGGLRRSHSSPNISQLLPEQDVLEPLQPHIPSVDRGSKPRSPRPEFSMMPAKAEVSAAKVRNLQPTWGNVKRGLTGLRNLGNTCYMNSTIQCLSNTTFMTKYFLTDNHLTDINRENILGKKGEVAEEFAVLIKALWMGQYRAINPRDFKSVIAKHHPLFAGYDQQDSQEMLLFLLDSLHEDLNKVRKRVKSSEQDNDGIPPKVAAEKAWLSHKRINDSVIVDLFQGQFMSTVTCLTCERKSVTFDTFMYLTVPIPSNTRCSLRDCIMHFAKEEKMTGDSRWRCPSCKCNRDCKKRIVIWRLPRILLIHLKRFYFQGMWRQKINAFVDFPSDGLDMNNYIQGPHTMGSYSLYAVSNHYGTMEGGHYTAFCKSPSNNHWYKYDDHECYEIPRSDVKSSAAYILYYTSIRQDIQFNS